MDHPNVNMRQRSWLEVVKDYDCEILYHPRKANVVADALGHKAMSAPIRDICMRMVIVSPLLELIKKAQMKGLKREFGRKQD